MEMDDKDIKDICDKVANQYASKFNGGDSVAEMWRTIIKLTSQMMADTLVEYNQSSGGQSGR